MRLAELYNLAHARLWSEKSGYDIFCSQIKRAVKILNNPKLEKIDTVMIDEYISKLEKTKSHMGTYLTNSTINRNLSVLHKLLDYAYKREYLQKMPHFSWKTENPHRVRWLTDKEENDLINALEQIPFNRPGDEQTVAAVKVLLDTGMRRSELLGLTNENIDGEWIRLWKTKNGKPRSIPLTSRSKELLTEHVPFTIAEHRLNRRWNKARKQLGLENDPQFVLHTLRHSCATRLLKKTKNIAMVQKMLGHAKINTTLRYAHIDDDDLLNAVNS